MKIYIAVWEDSKSGVSVSAFKDFESAKKKVKAVLDDLAEEFKGHPAFEDIDDSKKYGRELYRIEYGESNVHIVEVGHYENENLPYRPLYWLPAGS